MKKEQKNLKACLSYSVIILIFIISIILIYIYHQQANTQVSENLNNQLKTELPNIKKVRDEQKINSRLAEYNKLKNKIINLYLFDNKKPITDNSVIISYANLHNEKKFDLCVDGACRISTFYFPINIFKTSKTNILTDCDWKQEKRNKKIRQAQEFEMADYKEYEKIIDDLANSAIKKTELNPCGDDKNCPNIQDGGNYSFDINDGNFALIDLKEYPSLKQTVEINNRCHDYDSSWGLGPIN